MSRMSSSISAHSQRRLQLQLDSPMPDSSSGMPFKELYKLKEKVRSKDRPVLNGEGRKQPRPVCLIIPARAFPSSARGRFRLL